jgi:excisionase family DNA binding protein
MVKSSRPPSRRRPLPAQTSVTNDEYGKLWTMAHAAAQLGCARQKLYRLYDAGVLKLVKFGGNTRVTDASLRALLSGDSLPKPKLRRSYSKSTRE